MVYVLEGLYGVTILALLASLIFLIRGQRRLARRFTFIGAAGVVLSILLYWYLSPSA